MSAILAAALAIINAIIAEMPTLLALGADIVGMISSVETMVKASNAPSGADVTAIEDAVATAKSQLDAQVAALGQTAPNS